MTLDPEETPDDGREESPDDRWLFEALNGEGFDLDAELSRLLDGEPFASDASTGAGAVGPESPADPAAPESVSSDSFWPEPPEQPRRAEPADTFDALAALDAIDALDGLDSLGPDSLWPGSDSLWPAPDATPRSEWPDERPTEQPDDLSDDLPSAPLDLDQVAMDDVDPYPVRDPNPNSDLYRELLHNDDPHPEPSAISSVLPPAPLLEPGSEPGIEPGSEPGAEPGSEPGSADDRVDGRRPGAEPARTPAAQAVPERAPGVLVSSQSSPLDRTGPRVPRSILRRGVAVLLLQFLAVAYLTGVASLLFWSHAPELIGWHPRVVLTGSMMPVIQPGDVSVIGPAVVGATSLPRGRIVLVKDPQMRSGYYLHRVVRYDPQGRIITKGDANRSEDSSPVFARQIMGQLRLVVPIVGRPVVWLQNSQYLPVAVAGLGTWAALAVIAGSGMGRQDPARRRRPTSTRTTRAPATAP